MTIKGTLFDFGSLYPTTMKKVDINIVGYTYLKNKLTGEIYKFIKMRHNEWNIKDIGNGRIITISYGDMVNFQFATKTEIRKYKIKFLCDERV